MDVSVSEAFGLFGFGDEIQVLLPVLVNVLEAFGFGDEIQVLPPVLVQVSEAFGFADDP